VESVCQFRARQPDNLRYILHVMCNTYSIPSVDLYIAELRMLFGGHGTIEVQCWPSQPASPRSKKVAKYGIMEREGEEPVSHRPIM
jgi:hypothetical protein